MIQKRNLKLQNKRVLSLIMLSILILSPALFTSCSEEHQESQNAAEEATVEEGLPILLDNTLEVSIPAGYELKDGTYCPNGAESRVEGAILVGEEETITIRGWESADEENPYPLTNKINDAEISLTDAGKVYLISNEGKAYIRVGDITYEITSSDGDIKKDRIKTFIENLREHKQIEQCETCD